MEQGQWKKTFVDIGAGMGERFFKEAKVNPDKLYIIVDRRAEERN